MLIHYEIINRMSDSDKIHLLCDIRNLSEERYRAVGIPEIKLASAEEFCENEYPSPFALANTWDLSLMGRTAEALIKKSMTNCVDLLCMPDPKIKLNPYRKSLSEDPFLAGEFSGQYLEAAKRMKREVYLGEFGLHKDELEFVDEEPDERLIRECIEKPYRRAMAGRACKALLHLQDLNGTPYENVNSALAATASENMGVLTVCRKAGPENTVSCLEKGGLFFEGATLVAESALSRYKTLMKNIRQGIQSEEELAQEIEKNRVLSKEKLDEAMDRLLEFIFSVANQKILAESNTVFMKNIRKDVQTEEHPVWKEEDKNLSELSPKDALMKEATQKSVVLLKNKGRRLPLKRVKKIALIGDIAFEGETQEASLIAQCNQELTERGYKIIGMERGYEMNQFRSDGLMEPVFPLAKEADALIVFLGLGDARIDKARRAKKISIPANQMALLDSLKEYKDKIVAVMPSDFPADIGVAENCAAILLAPFGTKYSASVLADTLKGTWNPSGKLSSTLYLDSDSLYRQYVAYRKRDGLKQGTFIGYRYYDTANEEVAFPFGHGLSYSAFQYKKLTVKENVAYVTVKNIGRKAGDEIVQIYAGLETSSVVRPHKELCGFARVSLKPGKKQTLKIPLALPEVYDENTGNYVTEKGKYTIYAGASVSDIRLTCQIRQKETALESDQKQMSDYIHTKSNIHQDNYKLEAKIKMMKRSVFNLVAGLSAIAMAVILRLYCFSMAVNSDFFTVFQLFLAVFGVIFLIREAAHRNALRKREQELLVAKHEEMFQDAEEISKYEAEAMFSDAFEDSAEQSTETGEERISEGDAEYLDLIDKEQSFESVANEFEIYARERGSKIRSEDCKKIFSAMAASRLVVFSGLKDQDFQTLIHLLSDYFETSLHIEEVNDSYLTADRVLFKTDSQLDTVVKTHVHLAVDEARMNPQNICIAGLKNVAGENLLQYFTAYMTYIRNPLSNMSVKLMNELNVETSYYISPNLWFFMNLAENEAETAIPGFIAESASVVMLSLTECEESEMHTSVHKFGYYQLDYLAEKAISSYSMPEDIWKRADRLEDFVQRYSSFSIGNKLWLSFEKFAYVYLACGGSEAEAFDEAVAAKLILPMMILLDGKLTAEEKSFLETVETVFGEEHAEACRKLIRICEAHRAQND